MILDKNGTPIEIGDSVFIHNREDETRYPWALDNVPYIILQRWGSIKEAWIIVTTSDNSTYIVLSTDCEKAIIDPKEWIDKVPL